MTLAAVLAINAGRLLIAVVKGVLRHPLIVAAVAVVSLVRGISCGIRARVVEVWAIDPKGGMELKFGEELFHWLPTAPQTTCSCSCLDMETVATPNSVTHLAFDRRTTPDTQGFNA